MTSINFWNFFYKLRRNFRQPLKPPLFFHQYVGNKKMYTSSNILHMYISEQIVQIDIMNTFYRPATERKDSFVQNCINCSIKHKPTRATYDTDLCPKLYGPYIIKV